jgi:hypothetical protein
LAKIPSWERDETILALYTYLLHGRLRSNSPHIIQLSQHLRKLRNPNETPFPNKYRNPEAVELKLRKFANIDPNQHSGMGKGSKLEMEVWETYADNLEELSKKVTNILKRIGISNRIIAQVDELKVAISKRTEPVLDVALDTAKNHPLKVIIGSAVGIVSASVAYLFLKNKDQN